MKSVADLRDGRKFGPRDRRPSRVLRLLPLLFLLVLSSSLSAARADTPTANLLAGHYRPGDTTIDVVAAIPTTVDTAARSGAEDWHIVVTSFVYVSEQGSVEELGSVDLSIKNDTVFVESIDAESAAICLRLDLGTRPSPSPSSPSYSAILDLYIASPPTDSSPASTLPTDCGLPPPASDSTPPTITVTTPPEGAVYAQNQVANADYSCQDETGGSGLASCEGAAVAPGLAPVPVANGAPIDTSSAGAYSFTVSAADNAGNITQLTRTYFVTPALIEVNHRPGDTTIGLVVAIPTTVDTAARSGAEDWHIAFASLAYVSDTGAVEELGPVDLSIQNDTVLVERIDAQSTAILVTLDLGTHGEPEPNLGFSPILYLYIATPPPDSSPPTITLTTPPEGAVYALNQVVNADYVCQDEAGGSGLASCLGDVASGTAIDTASVGAKTFTVTAGDNVGNTSSVTHHYRVVYDFGGFLAPVNNPPTVNTGKAGRTYPVKWQLRDANGAFVTALSAVAEILVKPTSCAGFTDDPTDALETSTTGGTSLRYDSGSSQYVYNWATPKTLGCYTLFLKLDSGQALAAYFQLF